MLAGVFLLDFLNRNLLSGLINLKIFVRTICNKNLPFCFGFSFCLLCQYAVFGFPVCSANVSCQSVKLCRCERSPQHSRERSRALRWAGWRAQPCQTETNAGAGDKALSLRVTPPDGKRMLAIVVSLYFVWSA